MWRKSGWSLLDNRRIMWIMKSIIQFHVYRGDTHFVAECLDLPVLTQAKTLDELAKNIEEALEVHLEGESLLELGFVEKPSILVSFELPQVVHALS